jgi:hypothetical protein
MSHHGGLSRIGAARKEGRLPGGPGRHGGDRQGNLTEEEAWHKNPVEPEQASEIGSEDQHNGRSGAAGTGRIGPVKLLFCQGPTAGQHDHQGAGQSQGDEGANGFS